MGENNNKSAKIKFFETKKALQNAKFISNAFITVCSMSMCQFAKFILYLYC